MNDKLARATQCFFIIILLQYLLPIMYILSTKMVNDTKSMNSNKTYSFHFINGFKTKLFNR